jgi:hypothetical protein
MCGTPDFGALFEAASRIFYTVLFLTGTSAAYAARQAISSSLSSFMERIRTLF